MKEDILEQMVDDWLLGEPGTFTKHNVKFKPLKGSLGYEGKRDAIPSDIDILAVHLGRSENQFVTVVSCKSFQAGFNIQDWWHLLTQSNDQTVSGRNAWKHHRELCNPKWGKAFAERIFTETGSKNFTYILAVAHVTMNDETRDWKANFENEQRFIDNMKYDSSSVITIKLITVAEMMNDIRNRISGTMEATQFGRLVQVLKASNYLPPIMPINKEKNTTL